MRGICRRNCDPLCGSNGLFRVFLPMTLCEIPEVQSNTEWARCCNKSYSLKLKTLLVHTCGKLGEQTLQPEGHFTTKGNMDCRFICSFLYWLKSNSFWNWRRAACECGVFLNIFMWLCTCVFEYTCWGRGRACTRVHVYPCSRMPLCMCRDQRLDKTSSSLTSHITYKTESPLNLELTSLA